jgi:hypothetical protein
MAAVGAGGGLDRDAGGGAEVGGGAGDVAQPAGGRVMNRASSQTVVLKNDSVIIAIPRVEVPIKSIRSRDIAAAFLAPKPRHRGFPS